MNNTVKSDEFVSLFDVFSDGIDVNGKRRTIKDELLEIKTDLKSTMDSGLSPDDMKPAAMLYIAAQLAINIVDTL